MKSRMKKLVGVITAAVLTCAMTMGVMAAPSPTVSGVVNKVSGAVDANGNAVTVTLKEATVKVTDSELKDIMGNAFVEGMKVVDVKDVSVPAGTSFPVTITFTVPGVKADSKVALLHYTGSAWEVVNCKAGSGTIEGTFTSLSPVAFVVDGSAAAASATSTSSSTTSPKTGETDGITAAAVVALLAAGMGGVLFARRKRA